MSKAIAIVLLAIIAVLLAAQYIPHFEDPGTLGLRAYPIEGDGPSCSIVIDKYGRWDASCLPNELPAQSDPEGPSG